MSTAKVVSVNISKKKGTIKKPIDKITLNNQGIKDDAHSGSWHRQVSLLGTELIKNFCKIAKREILPGEFAENITTSGIDLTKVCILDRFKIANTELEVTQIGKACHGDTCAIYTEVGNCIMPKQGIFCRVIKGGSIEKEDKILYLPKTIKILIITLSDRVISGEYQDKSGPEIKKTLKHYFNNKPWKIDYINKIIPDEKKALTKKIVQALKDKIDIIFTTGGTGISSRDITPDVIMPMIDKNIPGIMEYIRNKSGEKLPNALISRSIAGIINKTLIFCLPGSQKAVKEYTEEIVKILEHCIFMINDIDIH